MDLSEMEMRQAIELAVGIERDLRPGTPGPVLHIIVGSRTRAIEALAALVTVDPRDENGIRDLQNVIAQHRNIIRYLSEAVAIGKDAAAKLSEEDLEDIENTLGLSENAE